MTGPGVDVEAFLGRLRGIAARWDAAHSELETMRMVATSDDGVATAAADSGGTLVDLTFNVDTRCLPGSEVAASVLRAGAQAVELANRRRAQLVSDSVGLAVRDRHRAAGAQADTTRTFPGTG